jgi:hypothetical protein
MMILFSVLMLAAEPAAAAAAPATPVQGMSAPAAAPQKVKEKKICKTADEDSSSHMIKRVCRTEQEWANQGTGGSSRSGMSLSGDAMQGH